MRQTSKKLRQEVGNSLEVLEYLLGIGDIHEYLQVSIIFPYLGEVVNGGRSPACCHLSVDHVLICRATKNYVGYQVCSKTKYSEKRKFELEHIFCKFPYKSAT